MGCSADYAMNDADETHQKPSRSGNLKKAAIAKHKPSACRTKKTVGTAPSNAEKPKAPGRRGA
jgi:hypothetical protein